MATSRFGAIASRESRRAGMLEDAVAKKRIDASGLVVCPGFIDIQGHSRDALLSGDGRVKSKVTQGVTTEIMGEGWTNAPANDRTIAVTKLLDPEDADRAREFIGPHGFDAWLQAMETPRILGQLRLVCRVGDDPGVRQGDGPGTADRSGAGVDAPARP